MPHPPAAPPRTPPSPQRWRGWGRRPGRGPRRPARRTGGRAERLRPRRRGRLAAGKCSPVGPQVCCPGSSIADRRTAAPGALNAAAAGVVAPPRMPPPRHRRRASSSGGRSTPIAAPPVPAAYQHQGHAGRGGSSALRRLPDRERLAGHHGAAGGPGGGPGGGAGLEGAHGGLHRARGVWGGRGRGRGGGRGSGFLGRSSRFLTVQMAGGGGRWDARGPRFQAAARWRVQGEGDCGLLGAPPPQSSTSSRLWRQ